jgi:hypothetical protein
MWKEQHLVQWQIPWMQQANPLKAQGVVFTISRCSQMQHNILDICRVSCVNYHTTNFRRSGNVLYAGIGTRYQMGWKTASIQLLSLD